MLLKILLSIGRWIGVLPPKPFKEIPAKSIETCKICNQIVGRNQSCKSERKSQSCRTKNYYV